MNEDNRVKFCFSTYQQYRALESHDSKTLYFTTSPNKIFRGDIEFSGGNYRLTSAEYETIKSLGQLDSKSWYFLVDNNDELKFIYVGETLIGRAGGEGIIGFPYTLPIVF